MYVLLGVVTSAACVGDPPTTGASADAGPADGTVAPGDGTACPGNNSCNSSPTVVTGLP